ncbi:BTAD domain-containing putative transcriptional regulator [Nonomuraea sp. NPDC050556]|uniref:AfsR/SARP family transcriptional regulator n=1 Tax=Nonomuraea sp. NPDC050556 TaxID=3364369 RepID=UPI0037ADD664
MTVTFHVLGPLEVRSAGKAVRISGRKPRMLLATLLLDANHVVSTDDLVEVLWPGRAPRSAHANVRTYVSSLRSDLGGNEVTGRGAGYMINLTAEQLDLLAFEDLVERRRLGEALALWRGAPLADLPGSPLWDRRLEPLAEVRLRARLDHADRCVEGGEHNLAVAELRGLLSEHPYREDVWQRLLLALHRGGRKAEALRAYSAIREQLVEELGVEPGAELRRVHETILLDEDTPRQLPPDIPDFTGRRDALAALAGPFSVAVVSGPPGVGKSALAVHGAHALRFPAGQLHLCLDRRDPADLLAEALRALGVTAPPPTLHERSALFRTLLAQRPMLVLLDDALDAEQVRPLLPGNDSVVIVTSRRRITELPGALQLQIDALDPDESLALLSRIVGAERVAREPAAARALVAACGHLPLAVRDVGARLNARPGWSLAVLRQRLDDDRLSELREVRVSLDRSFRLLPDDAASAFATLGLLGAHSLPSWVVDAVLGRHRADDVTDLLVDVNLLQLVGTDAVGQPRYRLPELVRLHAMAQPSDPAALNRVLAAWTATTEHATARLPASVFSLTAAKAARWRLPEQTLERLTADPLSWFEAEHDTLLGAVRLAADSGLTESAWGLAAAMVPYFDLHCHFDAWQQTHTTALAAARSAGDTYGEAAMLRGLAQVCLYQDRYEESAEQFHLARRLFRDLGDRRGEATSVCGLGAVSQFRGDHARAVAHFQRALAMFLAIEDRHGEAFVRQAIGRVCLKAGDLAQASVWLNQAMRLAQELGDSHREGCVSIQMGRLHDLGADAEQAMRFQGHALDIFDSLGDRHCGAYAMQSLAGLQAARGEIAPASAGLEWSLQVFQQLGDRSGEAATSQMLGELYRSAGRTSLARDFLRQAVTLRRSISP